MTAGDSRYFERIERALDDAMAVAERARERGGDPRPSVEIPVATDMADRVEKVLGIPGVADRVRELETDHTREEAALALVEDFVDGTVGDFDSRAATIEGAVRTAVALLTEGVVAAPIEGIDRVELLENGDGSEFVNVYYAGPIRSAGGTAQALSVLAADYARALLGIDAYRPREAEIGRYAEEVALYDDDVGLQYSPDQAETAFIAEHLPVMLDGEPTGGVEVSGHRDITRVDTNVPRGGMCLVLAEGIALKAPKIQRYTRDLDAVDWPWLDDLIHGEFGDGEPEPEATADDPAAPAVSDGPPRVAPSKTYLRDLIAGRPVLSHPSQPGGFRLRYGRARNHGFATAGVHPATMHLVEDFLATGTQLKTELPGKAAGVVPVDTIDGPTVRLANGDVRRIDDPAEAREVRPGVDAILDLGEFLVNFGEFVENNHRLAPASYTVEWWAQDFVAAGGPIQALQDRTDVDLRTPDPLRALEWATEFDAPLHPAVTYLWHDIDVSALCSLADALDEASVLASEGDGTLAVPRQDGVRDTLETLLVEHTQDPERLLVPTWRPLVRTLGFDRDRSDGLERTWTPDQLSTDARTYADGENAIEAVNEVAPFEVRERAPTRVGARMGRPEKSEERELSPAVHTLFPIGDAGGDQRSVGEAAGQGDAVDGTKGEVAVEVGRRECLDCGTRSFRPRCPDCGGPTRPVYACPDCEREVEPDDPSRAECPRCERPARPTERRTIDIAAEFHESLEAVDERPGSFEILKGVKGLTSPEKTPEPMAKGILRAKHDVSAFKDGTVRYDMTDLPVTSVRPSELSVSVERFRELGYDVDIHGDPLEGDDQLVELNVQDVILSEGAAEHLGRTADFVDDLLERYYDMEPYYEVEDRDDLVGELVFGMAPHTSAAVVGRVVGFTSAAVGYAHPYFHASKRRNCFHPETTIQYYDADGQLRRASIAQFVERRLDDPETDAFGVERCDLSDPISVRSLADDGSWVQKPVRSVSRHPAPDHLVRIETEQRSVTVTPDHAMVRWAGGVESVPAHALDPGDRIPVPPRIDGRRPVTARADGGLHLHRVTRVSYVSADVDQTYCLSVADTHRVVANGMTTGQCDGDEDCVMLLLDGLLNFSKTYLPDQRGGSVAADTRLVAVDPDDTVRFLTFEEFWAELEAPIDVDGKFRKRTCATEGWRTYAFDDTHASSLQPIEKAIRYRAAEDEPLVRIETALGRSIEVTEHHSLFRYDDGIEEVAGAALAEGDLLVAPRSLDVSADRVTVDVATCVPDPHVVIDDRAADLLLTALEPLPGEDSIGDPHHTDTLPLTRFEERLAEAGWEVPADVRVTTAEATDGIVRRLTLDEDLAWLLGVYSAAGASSTTGPVIRHESAALLDRATTIAEATLGHTPDRRPSSRGHTLQFPAVVGGLLEELDVAPRDAHETGVPGCILRAPRGVVAAFLRGRLAGATTDGDPPIRFRTRSEAAKDGLVFLLHRLGLVASVTDPDCTMGPGYTIAVPETSATDLTLERETEPLPPNLDVPVPDALVAIGDIDLDGETNPVPQSLRRQDTVTVERLRDIVRALESRTLPDAAADRLDELRPLVDGDLSFVRVTGVESVAYDGYLYDLQVGNEPVFAANWLYAHNSMDAPLVMSSRVDPAEIDDEAHNLDVVDRYPRALYEASRELAYPDTVEVPLAGDTVGTDQAYSGFEHTHDTSNIAAGPALSAYKTLGSMEEKMDAQLALSRTIRAVDERDVAERLIDSHFLPDLIGNLRAFSRQETRCHACGTKYRRPPLSSQCRECGGDVHLTVHEGSVTKYLDTAVRVAEEFGAREYTKQRLEIIGRRIERVFEDDQNKQSGIADFM